MSFKDITYDPNTDTILFRSRKSTQKNVSIPASGGYLPVGAIIPWIGGYFTNGSNGSFTLVLANTIADVNTLMNSQGLYVCDGSPLNISKSAIFNGSGRYLPNISDSRFLMGSTTAGAGASNSASFTGNAVASSAATVNTSTRNTDVALSSHSVTWPTYTVNAHNHQWLTSGRRTFDSGGSQIDIFANVTITSGSGYWGIGCGYSGYTSNLAPGTSITSAGSISDHTITQPTFTVDAHTHTTTATGSVTNVIPTYLQVFYLMRVW